MKTAPPPPSAADLAVGFSAESLAVLVWAGWIVITRFAVDSDSAAATEPAALALFRYGIPALVLAPLWLRRGLFPKGTRAKYLVLMTIGWGAPFVMLTGEGLKTVPAGLFGPLVPGIAPLFLVLITVGLMRETITRTQAVGCAIIVVSAGAIIAGWLVNGNVAELAGAPFLLAAAIGWATYTAVFRHSGLGPLEASGYVGLYSMVLLIPLLAWHPELLTGMPPATMALHAVTQGLLAGVVSVMAYGVAIRRLGPVRAISFTALVPVCAALGGMLFLGEVLVSADWIAILGASVGVATVNGVFNRWVTPGASV